MSKVAAWISVGVGIIGIAVSVAIPEVRYFTGLENRPAESSVALASNSLSTVIRLEEEIVLKSGVPHELFENYFITYYGIDEKAPIWVPRPVGDLKIVSIDRKNPERVIIHPNEIYRIRYGIDLILFQVASLTPDQITIK